MKRKLPALIVTLALSASTLPAANIAWVSFHSADNTPSGAESNAGFTKAPDVGYTALLAANGHTVTRFVRVNDIQVQPDLLTALGTNDLIIISRSVPSGDFQQLDEATAWNGITNPVMILGGFVTRGGTGGGSRLGLTTGETIADVNVDPLRLRVNAPGHPHL